MKEKQIVGIDVSKLILDVFILPSGNILKISNDEAGFIQLKQAISEQYQSVIVMEHTGRYSLKLEQFLAAESLDYCKVAALEIKRSVGLVRGKSDKIDAMRIAEYGWLRRDQLKLTQATSAPIVQLENLLSLRGKLAKDSAGYKSRLKEMLATGCCKKNDALYKTQQQVIRAFTKQIQTIETAIQQIIVTNPELKKNCELIMTIKGVGPVVAVKLLTVTHNFKKYTDARKFNCYAGVAPFKHESGSSIKGRSRVSHLANKEVKTLLSLAAFAAIRFNPELKAYYQKRVAEGKHKMSCVNMIRAKIISRVFAIIKRQTPYQTILVAA